MSNAPLSSAGGFQYSFCENATWRRADGAADTSGSCVYRQVCRLSGHRWDCSSGTFKQSSNVCMMNAGKADGWVVRNWTRTRWNDIQWACLQILEDTNPLPSPSHLEQRPYFLISEPGLSRLQPSGHNSLCLCTSAAVCRAALRLLLMLNVSEISRLKQRDWQDGSVSSTCVSNLPHPVAWQ